MQALLVSTPTYQIPSTKHYIKPGATFNNKTNSSFSNDFSNTNSTTYIIFYSSFSSAKINNKNKSRKSTVFSITNYVFASAKYIQIGIVWFSVGQINPI